MHNYTYLALGDSYTIGEGVPLHQSFPYQTVSLLRTAGYHFGAPEIVAKTGWTTDELEAAMAEHQFMPKYDFVSLLVGVNNQYRGRTVLEYKEQFERLLKRGIALAAGKPEHLVVVSIPDYSVTPFGQEREPEKTAKDLDAFNALNRALSVQFKTQYLDITESTRAAKDDPSLLAADGLHPSAAAYRQWAQQLADILTVSCKH